jgi:hypothetical protein
VDVKGSVEKADRQWREPCIELENGLECCEDKWEQAAWERLNLCNKLDGVIPQTKVLFK